MKQYQSLKPKRNNNFIYQQRKTNFDNLSFDELTSEELALVKGGKEEDVYIDPIKHMAAFSMKKKQF